ncbi:GNAT family N-acetyltransferase [Methylobacterium sp. J-067]|jgi:putative hemolysin|uniref:GNAT family N-acetyltransferase n=1 Tax=Methylobacterium sp. J-067 TaxID=2836648 RepID=UPI001FBA0335|nr:GNAT family N-acyltransferase [Methylobacterium sp. J-067]MCJ2023764.1 GNAT family N-acetyltransferase [Methylobacterium sp. J-067]
MAANLFHREAVAALGAGLHRGVQWGVTAPLAKLTRRPTSAEIADVLAEADAIRLPEPGADGLKGRSLGRIGNLEVRLATRRSEIRRAQRLRFKVFYEEMSAVPTGLASLSRRDADAYDSLCDHLLVLDHDILKPAKTPFRAPRPKVVGTYRLLRGEVAERHHGFYSEGEYDLSPVLAAQGGRRLLELGRSCVLKPYRGKRTVELLWQGIYAYVLHHRIDALIGCASLEGTDPDRLALPLSFLHHHARAPEAWRACALPERAVRMDRLSKEAVDPKAALQALPPLIKGYLRLGATFGDGAVVDRQFGTTDVFVALPVERIGARYRGHFAPA